MTPSNTLATRTRLSGWVLRLAALATPTLFIHECVIYALTQDSSSDGIRALFHIYLAVAFVLGGGNVAAWWRFRNHATTTTTTALVLWNLCGFAVFVAFGMKLYGVHVTPMLLPVFTIAVVMAAILCELVPALCIALVAAGLHAALIFWARTCGLLEGTGSIEFLPAASVFLPVLVLPIAYITRTMVQGEEKLRALLVERDAAHEKLQRAQTALQKHVAPQLARMLFEEGAEAALEHKRRKVTLFFSDVKDFTISVDAIEPEELGKLLNEYLDEMVRIAIAHNGTVCQISGDGLFIIFGAPEFESDAKHALDAVRMAVAMQKRMIELGKRWFLAGTEHPFQIRCGVNTGMATVGAFGAEGRREYSAVGLQTNIAARLEGACTPGRILMSHATWALVHDVVSTHDQGDKELKGVGRPMRCYEVVPSEN
jgi:class 3 adenylate cyclase